jgi:putative serine protease PepD
VTLGSSGGLQVGDTAIAIGSPLGLTGTVTSGIVSALNRPVTAGGQGEGSYINAIQTDAAINPGNSGGPLVNGLGQVIGVNSAIATLGIGGTSGSIGLGFAIPIDTAKRIAEEIIATGTSSTPVIGVRLDMNYTGSGARIEGVNPGGPAEAAGVREGDVVTKVDGRVVEDATALIVAIRAKAPGDALTLTIDRDGEEQDLTVTLGTLEP